ncbi:MAG: efflux RND transporter periplasmic adaptor subunit, partial [Motiliproteus sp.]|nr:efflux RND transporter periplasmic adaptor subunit [Motiliproteus sp.]
MFSRSPISKTSILLLTILLAAPAFSQDKPQGLPAEVIEVQPRVLERTLEVVGSLRANEAVIIRPEQTGRIDAIHFQEGQAVEKGSPLFTLESSTYRAALEQAQAREKLSRIEYNQAQELLGKKLGSKHARDSALAQLQIDQARTKLAKTELNKMTIYAPFSGITGLREISIGDYVNSGENLVELVDLQQIKADFRVAEV